MAQDREKISTGPNEEAINETIAGTGPGIPDDALAPGEDLPQPPTDEEVQETAEKLHAPGAQRDTLPLKVNESREADSVIVQFRSLLRVP